MLVGILSCFVVQLYLFYVNTSHFFLFVSKKQIINTLGFVGYRVSVTSTSGLPLELKTAMGKM